MVCHTHTHTHTQKRGHVRNRSVGGIIIFHVLIMTTPRLRSARPKQPAPASASAVLCVVCDSVVTGRHHALQCDYCFR